MFRLVNSICRWARSVGISFCNFVYQNFDEVAALHLNDIDEGSRIVLSTDICSHRFAEGTWTELPLKAL